MDAADKEFVIKQLESVSYGEVTFTMRDGKVELARKMETAKPNR
jgi:hypothetical protein